MADSLYGVIEKLHRAEAHINDLYGELNAYLAMKPYSIRVDKDHDDSGRLIGQVVAVKNPDFSEPDVSVVLIAGEALYQIRSALDHIVHRLVIANGETAKVKNSRRHQFPIFDTPDGYRTKAGGMIDGVSQTVAAIIESEQPYRRTPNSAHNDMLWILQDLINTDKHRLLPITVVGIDVINILDAKGIRATGQSPDIVLEHEKMLFWFIWPEPDEDIRADLSCTVAFSQAMSPLGTTLGIPGLLLGIASRAYELVDRLRQFA